MVLRAECAGPAREIEDVASNAAFQRIAPLGRWSNLSPRRSALHPKHGARLVLRQGGKPCSVAVLKGSISGVLDHYGD